MPDLIAFIYKHGDNDYEIYFPPLSLGDEERIREILEPYTNEGYSARGTAQDVGAELR